MADASSTPLDDPGTVTLHEVGYCQFCGVRGTIVERFPRRGYGRGVVVHERGRSG